MPDRPPVYLDHAATTPMRPEAVHAMLPFLTGRFGNPSGSHALARDARRALDDARDVMAEAVGAEPGQIVFTSGGTEADNTAIGGVLARRPGGVAVGSAIEHHAVLAPVEAAGGRLVPVDRRGVISLDALGATLDELGPRTAVVSVMLANNEVGTVQPLWAVAEVVRTHAPDALLHTDAVQAFSWLDVADAASEADLLSLSAHKFGGPKGVGVLVMRDRAAGAVAPMLTGGGQERDRRSGTQNVAGIAAMAAAARATVEERKATVDRVAALRDRLVDGLLDAVPHAAESGVPARGQRDHKVAGAAPVCFEAIESEALLFLLDQAGICATAGSSCASGALDPSPVLAAMGVPRDLAAGALRLSLGWCSTDADVDDALAAVPAAVTQLRAGPS